MKRSRVKKKSTTKTTKKRKSRLSYYTSFLSVLVILAIGTICGINYFMSKDQQQDYGIRSLSFFQSNYNQQQQHYENSNVPLSSFQSMLNAFKGYDDTNSNSNTNSNINVNNNIDNNNNYNATIHVVFSTSCHVKQDWQSYLFFYQAMVQQQPGTVTRIVSGCKGNEKEKLLNEFNEKISIMSNRFHVHFTPEYGRIPGKSWQVTKYWNKPFGLRHWFEDKFGYNMTTTTKTVTRTTTTTNTTTESSSLPLMDDDDIIVLVDPDMLIQRPFVNYFPNYIKDLWIKQVQTGQTDSPIRDHVSRGKPIGQDYLFEAQWLPRSSGGSKKKNLTHVVGPDSPVHNLSMIDARVYYSVGPPYIATASDMYQISYYWSKFLPKIFDLHPQFMAEMYGYCMAAAHLGLKHQIAKAFMVSNPGLHDEGWGFLKLLPNQKSVCDVKTYQEIVPQVLHYCQRYSIGEYFLSKYKLPVDILSCDFPLLELPPLDIAAFANYSHYGDDSVIQWGRGSDQRAQLYRHAYMVCSLMPAINNAARFYKDHHCPNGANYNETWNTFTSPEFEEEKMQNLKKKERQKLK